jgi:hypothetical protein
MQRRLSDIASSSTIATVVATYSYSLVGCDMGGGLFLCFTCLHVPYKNYKTLVQAWDVRNTCKHSGAVLPLPSAPVGRGVDGIDAMA